MEYKAQNQLFMRRQNCLPL